MKPIRLLVILIFVAIQIMGCDSGSSSAASGSVLFQDIFDDVNSGWNRVRSANGDMTDYENSAYHILNNQANTHIWANPGLKFKDVRVEVDVAKTNGPDDNFFGVICRYKDGKNFYLLAISSDGYYGIIKVKDGQLNLLGSQDMQPGDPIRQGNATNHLRADCVGKTLTLYVNDQLMSSVEDGDFSAGDVGLEVSARQAAGVDVLFDNFSVLKP